MSEQTHRSLWWRQRGVVLTWFVYVDISNVLHCWWEIDAVVRKAVARLSGCLRTLLGIPYGSWTLPNLRPCYVTPWAPTGLIKSVYWQEKGVCWHHLINHLSYCRFPLLIHPLKHSLKAGSQGFCFLIVRENESSHVGKDGGGVGNAITEDGVIEIPHCIGQ